MYGFPRTRHVSEWRRMISAIGTVNGSNTVFRIPSRAYADSVEAYQILNGVYTKLTITENYRTNVVLGITPTVNAGASGGYFGSSPSSCMVDGNRGTPPFWSPAYTVPEVSWAFAIPITPTQVYLEDSYTGGFGGCITYHLDYSNNGTTWTRLLTSVGRITMNDIAPGIRVSAAYWRIVGDTRGSFEWAIAEIELYATLPYSTQFTTSSAPASGSRVVVTYREYPK